MSLFHKNKNKVDKGIKKMDTIITGLILGGIVASVYGIKKHEKELKEAVEELKQDSTDENKKMTFSSIMKALVFGFKEEKKVKKGFFAKIFSIFSRGEK